MGVCEKSVHTNDIVDGKRYILLDTLQDPGNIGTIMRTSLALGIDQVIMSKDCVDLYNDKVIRATQGALFKLPVCIMDLGDAIYALKEKGVSVYGTCLQNAASPTRERQKQPSISNSLKTGLRFIRPAITEKRRLWIWQRSSQRRVQDIPATTGCSTFGDIAMNSTKSTITTGASLRNSATIWVAEKMRSGTRRTLKSWITQTRRRLCR